MRVLRFHCAIILHAFLLHSFCAGALAADRAQHQETFDTIIRPLLKRYCIECHSREVTEADIDLSAFNQIEDVRAHLNTWVKVRRILGSRQMPPPEADQPSDSQRNQLETWVRAFLTSEAESRAGDPGPVVLRRLSNAEYTYSLRDLTGLKALSPASEFPVDGAAGEGFTNVGSGQGMSPALLQKYLDAAKQVASHAVLLPDGIAFSEGRSKRDWTDKRLAAIRAFYERYTVVTEVHVDVGGTGKVANQGGAIPLAKYLAATLEEREALIANQTSPEAVALQRSLHPKYFAALWTALHRKPKEPSLLLGQLRKQWQHSEPADVPQLVAEIKRAQNQLWKFNSIGQLTEGGKQKTWMEPVTPVVTRQELRLPLQTKTDQTDVTFYLAASDLGDGREQDFVVWERPRIEFRPKDSGAGHPPLLLRDVPELVERTEKFIQAEAPRSTAYLEALAAAHSSGATLSEIAQNRGLHGSLLEHWSKLTGLVQRIRPEIRGHFLTKLTRAQGYADVNGWGTNQTPNMLTNRSEEDISFLTLTVPARGVVVHPSPTQESMVAWRSPLAGSVQIEGRVADADHQCGNGASWRLELWSASGKMTLARGEFDNGGKGRIQVPGEIQVRSGDVVSLLINSRDQSHVCDTTHVELTISEVAADPRRWDLADDVVEKISEGNPLADSYGNQATWHFGATGDHQERRSVLIPGSTLAKWRAAVANGNSADEIERLAKSIQRIMATDQIESLNEPDRRLHAQLTDWRGPLAWMSISESRRVPKPKGIQILNPPHRFGVHPNGSEWEDASLCVQAPKILEVRLPAKLVKDAELVVSARLHEDTARQGSVQVQVSHSRASLKDVSLASPFLVSDGGAGHDRVKAAIAEFQELFPPMLCYWRIVPVDEVVTLTLFFREDNHLQRLMLDEAEVRELNRLWDELWFVAQEPIALSVALEQIYQFATQDRPDLVKEFGPMREPVNDRADRFRARLRETEPVHLNAVTRFADRAWRRPLSDAERQELTGLYRGLRGSGMTHEEAIRLTLARVLTSPAFLYKLEQPLPEVTTSPVTGLELATRLSYFLWSSLPDEPLRRLAEAGQLTDDEAVIAQSRRMLDDPRTRRLAIQFACQWLHLRGFDQNDDKNERVYPEFAALKRDMYEETVRFFEDIFRSDRSILEILAADHTFLNQQLAGHYGIDGVSGSDWRRVDGVQSKGRGGVLGMATFLSSQSGATRTSPILRGNWVYETLLGERLPRPPANVPQLPDELPEGLTARELIERHSSDPACSKCHARIDPYGFSLEQYDAIGRLRHQKVDTTTTIPGGQIIEGIDGLRRYLMTDRRDDFVRQFCRKLLGYALGREILLSDEPLIRKMHAALKNGNYRARIAIEIIVTSRQFRELRGQRFTSQ